MLRAARRYVLVTRNRAGKERLHEYASERELVPGDVIVVEGRHWLVERVEDGDGATLRAYARPALYRLRLRHPDGREEAGAFRRFRPDGPRLGHAFTTVEDGELVSWQVVEERLAHDENREPYLDLVATRDYGEFEALPDHELEHSLAVREWQVPAAATAVFSRAEQGGLSIELVALEAGEVPDWTAAEQFVGALVLEELEDDLIELCGVDPDNDPREVCSRPSSSACGRISRASGPTSRASTTRSRNGSSGADASSPPSGRSTTRRIRTADTGGCAGWWTAAPSGQPGSNGSRRRSSRTRSTRRQRRLRRHPAEARPRWRRGIRGCLRVLVPSWRGFGPRGIG